MEGEDKKDKESRDVFQGHDNLPSNISNLDVLSFSGKDKESLFFFKKVERLASAIYLVTGALQDSEPLRHKLRKCSTELVSYSSLSLGLRDLLSSESFQENIRLSVFKIVSFLEVAVFGNLVSTMNASLLKREFSTLLRYMIDNFRTKREGKEILNENFFYPRVGSETRLSAEESRSDQSRTLKTFSHESLKDTSSTVPQGIDRKRSLKDFSPVSVKKNQRKSVIINLLKRKREIMIKDVTPLVPNCSEKTLQRELLALVKEGVLRKEGARRWTKYSLA